MTRGMRTALAAGLVVALAAAGAGVSDAAAKRAQAAKRDAVGLGVGYRPPEFSGTDLQGRTHTLAAYRGSVLVLHFWATWCPYCRGEIPELTQLSGGEWAGRGVRVLAVSTDQGLEKLRRFVGKSGLPYAVIADAQQDFMISDKYGISGIPVTYVIGRDGHIASRLSGAGDIIAEVRKALEAPVS